MTHPFRSLHRMDDGVFGLPVNHESAAAAQPDSHHTGKSAGPLAKITGAKAWMQDHI